MRIDESSQALYFFGTRNTFLLPPFVRSFHTFLTVLLIKSVLNYEAFLLGIVSGLNHTD